jgi:anti-sigma regulatory factor (Ser/Thr protein kinase)
MTLFQQPLSPEPSPLERRGRTRGMQSTDIAGGALAGPSARRLVATFASEMSGDALDDALLVTSELVNNSVEHGGTSPDGVVRLDIQLSGDVLTVQVSDSGPGFVRPESLAFDDDLEATSGRGLRILDALTDRWGVTTTGGTRVWFEMPARRNH